MKKRVFLVSSTIVLLIGLVFCFVKKENLEKQKDIINNNTLAIYLEESFESGTYVLSNTKVFPTSGYTLNTDRSSCTNGGTISQSRGTKLISTNFSKTDKCTLYFDRSGKTDRLTLPEPNLASSFDSEINLYTGDYEASATWTGTIPWTGTMRVQNSCPFAVLEETNTWDWNEFNAAYREFKSWLNITEKDKNLEVSSEISDDPFEHSDYDKPNNARSGVATAGDCYDECHTVGSGEDTTTVCEPREIHGRVTYGTNGTYTMKVIIKLI